MPVTFGETTGHLTTRIKEHLETGKMSHIFAHLANNKSCKAVVLKTVLKLLTPPLLHLGLS